MQNKVWLWMLKNNALGRCNEYLMVNIKLLTLRYLNPQANLLSWCIKEHFKVWLTEQYLINNLCFNFWKASKAYNTKQSTMKAHFFPSDSNTLGIFCITPKPGQIFLCQFMNVVWLFMSLYQLYHRTLLKVSFSLTLDLS